MQAPGRSFLEWGRVRSLVRSQPCILTAQQHCNRAAELHTAAAPLVTPGSASGCSLVAAGAGCCRSFLLSLLPPMVVARAGRGRGGEREQATSKGVDGRAWRL
ncbi:hypothetical protein HaLaN_09738 [Haematococcus lacustris]|uniref:Uncharacterized protein n=1 Tax=Haematococcus lacustris TaxID=44745 RepID=A0A699YW45_HAELA|nr:hypothetical protein HaLaN_09738 [Haematococcus lacustris]